MTFTEFYRKTVKEATLSDVVWWVFLILLILGQPIYAVYSTDFSCNGVTEEKPWWLYFIGIVAVNFFYVIVLVLISLLGLIFGKIGAWIYESKR